MKTMLVIGIGRFGKHLAIRLSELGNEVMIVDKQEERVNELLSIVTFAQIGDCTNESMLSSLGVNNFDTCFVCIGEDFQSSLEITSLLKDLGAKYVVSKANRAIHEKFLLRNGADEIIHPERDAALRAGRKYSNNNIFDFFELTSDFSISEVLPPDSWIGKSIKQVNVRSKYNINIVGIKKNNKVMPITSVEYIFNLNEHLIIVGNLNENSRLFEKNK